ncbi:matrixin family metalloprotease [Methanolapillus millepedarum]|uniref:Peptidase M10 metallopeptidase domain-containing protein n=1 Tax=Methanolapillus millepedarum TaxID=3028296 RepID=A0AA96ZW56_9EURY|nr:hypothetical protein MsAc7_11190 [Methanosarcinaceae archaeon Ac7]
MKKYLSILFVCILLISICSHPASALLLPWTSYGVYNTTVNVSFTNDYSSSWKTEIMAAASTWESAGSTFARKPQFWNKSVYNSTDGVSFSKSSFTNGSTALATTSFTSITKNGKTYINSSRVTFNTNHNFTTNISNISAAGRHPNGTIYWGVYDVQSISLHELGHSLGLADNTVNNSSIMYQPARMTQSLGTYDKNDLKTIYNVLIAKSIMGNMDIGNVDLKNEKIFISTSINYIPLSEDLMVDVSDLIVKGKVKEVLPSKWNTSDGKSPSYEDIGEYGLYHDVIIEVEDIYKGSLPDSTNEIKIRRFGGSLDNVEHTLDMRDYSKGSEMILYLIEGTDISPSTSKDVTCYTELNGNGQLLIVNDMALNAYGESVDINKQVMPYVR